MQESVAVNPTVLADPTAAPESEQPSKPSQSSQPSANGGSGLGDNSVTPPTDTSASANAPARACANCGAQLDDGQDWCLQCGASVPGSLDGGGPSWRSATIVLAATTALVLGAAAAAYAALTQPSPHTVAPRVVTIAQVPATTPGAEHPDHSGYRHDSRHGYGHDARRAGYSDDDQTASGHEHTSEDSTHRAHAQIVGHDDHAV